MHAKFAEQFTHLILFQENNKKIVFLIGVVLDLIHEPKETL